MTTSAGASPKVKAAKAKAVAKAKAKAKRPTPRPVNLSFRLVQYKETVIAFRNALFYKVVESFIDKAVKASAPALTDWHVCSNELYERLDSFRHGRETVADVLELTEGQKSFWIKGRIVK
jgi:hypothetical protein